MSLIPVNLLRKLYVLGSLTPTEDGFRFQMKNTLAKGTLVAMSPLTLDGGEIPLGSTTVSFGQEEIGAGDITPENPRVFPVNVPVTIAVKGVAMPNGQHTLVISCTTREFGAVSFDVQDEAE